MIKHGHIVMACRPQSQLHRCNRGIETMSSSVQFKQLHCADATPISLENLPLALYELQYSVSSFPVFPAHNIYFGQHIRIGWGHESAIWKISHNNYFMQTKSIKKIYASINNKPYTHKSKLYRLLLLICSDNHLESQSR